MIVQACDRHTPSRFPVPGLLFLCCAHARMLSRTAGWRYLWQNSEVGIKKKSKLKLGNKTKDKTKVAPRIESSQKVCHVLLSSLWCVHV